jgi:hypothetical protein
MMTDFPSSGRNDAGPSGDERAFPHQPPITRRKTPRTSAGQSPSTGSGTLHTAEQATLVRFTVYWLPDSGPAIRAPWQRRKDLPDGRLLIEWATCPRSRADIDRIAFGAQYAKLDVSADRREEITSAAADYAASRVQGQWDTTWWQTPRSFPLSQAVDLLNGSAEWLREQIAHPVADAASSVGAAGPIVPIGSGITASFVTARLTAPLKGAARVCEVTGIVIGLVTGLHPLVLASAKRLAHDELGDALARGFEQLIDSLGSGPDRTAELKRGADSAARDRYPGASREDPPEPVREPPRPRRPGPDDNPARDRYPGASREDPPEPVREPPRLRRLGRDDGYPDRGGYLDRGGYPDRGDR